MCAPSPAAYTAEKIPGSLMARFPKLEIVSSFGVGYDHIDAKWAAAHGIIVTNTPEVLPRKSPIPRSVCCCARCANFRRRSVIVRAGKWLERGYPLSKATLRNRTVGMVGMGAIGQAIARRLDAFGVPVVYHTRQPRPELPIGTIPS